MQIQISWLPQKPTDLDLHCLQEQDISRFSRTRVKGDVSRELNWFTFPVVFFSTDRSKAAPLLQFFFVCVSMGSCVAVVLSLFVPHLSFFLCFGKAVFHDCGISWISSLILWFRQPKTCKTLVHQCILIKVTS